MPEIAKEQPELAQWLVKEWASRLHQVVASMTGVVPEIRYLPVAAGGDVASAHRIWWRQPFSCPAEAVLWAGGDPQSSEEVGRRVLAAAGIDNATPENQRGTFQEVLNQALANLAQALSSRLRKPIGCKDGAESPLAEAASLGSSVVLVWDGLEVPSPAREAQVPARGAKVPGGLEFAIGVGRLEAESREVNAAGIRRGEKLLAGQNSFGVFVTRLRRRSRLSYESYILTPAPRTTRVLGMDSRPERSSSMVTVTVVS